MGIVELDFVTYESGLALSVKVSVDDGGVGASRYERSIY